ncbi:hypothetical protein [Myxococcus sp. Y35]
MTMNSLKFQKSGQYPSNPWFNIDAAPALSGGLRANSKSPPDSR